MNERKLTCIMCPKGCSLIVKEEKGEIIVTGNACDKGQQYALSELTNPQRFLTTTLRLDSDSSFNRIAVMSKTFVNKSDLVPLCIKLKDVVIKRPVKQGDTLCIVDGVEFVASSTVE